MNIEKELLVFCENVKRLRRMSNLSRAQMAKLLCISVKTLDTIESGKVPPKLGCNILFEIRYCFGVPAHKMLSRLIGK